MNLKNKLHKMFNFLLCSLQIHKIEVCLNLCYIFIKARELYRQKIHFFCLMHTWEYTIIWIIAHLKPQRITDCLHKNVEEVNQVYLPDLGHTCRSEDKRDSLSKYAAVWELWLPHLVPLEPRLTKHHHLGYWNTFFCTWISSSSSNKIMAFRRQREYKVIFIYLDCIETIQGNSALPSPQLTDLIYTLISTTSSHPLGVL
jgi:hypothetical protein